MAGPTEVPLHQLLAAIGRLAPQPLFPAEFAEAHQIPRDSLERALDQLRIARLIEFTPWELGRGQGLKLTSAGAQILQSPAWMSRFARGILPNIADTIQARPESDADGTTFAKGEAIRASLMRPTKPRITQALIAINVLVFVVGLLISRDLADPQAQGNGRIDALIRTGAVTGIAILHGEWWRLLACCFVHFNLLHLGMNMYALWVLGPMQERLWGKTRYLAIYLIAGIVGSCVAMIRQPEAVLAGASGCIWGLLASQLVWLLMNRSHLPSQLAAGWIRQLVIIIVLNAVFSMAPGISAEAHFAGGITGAIVATLLQVHRFNRTALRWLALSAVALLPLVSVGALAWAVDNSSQWRQYTRHVQIVIPNRPVSPDDPRGP
jgi:rhomboid protease GluP